jgi:hypothetical protein
MDTDQTQQEVQPSNKYVVGEAITSLSILLTIIFELLIALNSIYYSQVAPGDHNLSSPLVKFYTSLIYLIVSGVTGSTIGHKFVGWVEESDSVLEMFQKLLIYASLGPGLLTIVLVLF